MTLQRIIYIAMMIMAIITARTVWKIETVLPDKDLVLRAAIAVSHNHDTVNAYLQDWRVCLQTAPYFACDAYVAGKIGNSRTLAEWHRFLHDRDVILHTHLSNGAPG